MKDRSAVGSRSSLDQRYRARFPKSAELYRRALDIFPSGVTHDGRFMKPFPIYVERARGSRKWDVDGNEIVDYWVGHGALLLGHQRPEVVEAVRRQAERGTHYGACHELEIEWGSLVKRLIPSAERVRFTSSGTEATLMAIRLARACTGRRKVIKFEGHFHGWHDGVMFGVNQPFHLPDSPGILKGVEECSLLSPPNDIEALRKLVAGDDDIACIIIEPSGATFGTIPTRRGFLAELRSLASERGIVLIFDEVVTGFRMAPGGAQELYGVIPDLTSMAKILAGGLPGGALAGREEIMEHLEFKEDPDWNSAKRMYHPGTYNANPLSASAGVAALSIVSTGEDIERADALAAELRDRMNRVIEDQGVNWLVYGDSSFFHILMDHDCSAGTRCDLHHCNYDYRKLKTGASEKVHRFREAMLLGGVDLPGVKGMLSSAHTEEDLERTAEAFNQAIKLMKEDGSV